MTDEEYAARATFLTDVADTALAFMCACPPSCPAASTFSSIPPSR